MTNLYLDLHVIQTVPSANLNRDDAGSPKTALYGGVTRSRVSSQAWKRVMRQGMNAANVTTEGLRTKTSAALLAKALTTRDGSLSEEDAMAKAAEVYKIAGIKLNKDNETGALLLISQGQVDKLAEYALSHDLSSGDKTLKTDIKKVLKGNQSLDLALFGRMVADDPELNVEGSAQVAHAISTHEIVPEFDYFTAVDDQHPEDNAGAAMIGTIEYNSATLYRYANLNLHEFIANVGEDAAMAGMKEYIKQFILSMPTGKQNTFANKTVPSYVMVTLRDDTPVNLVSAFEQPVQSNTGYVAPSITRLEQEYEETQQFVDTPLANFTLSKTEAKAGTPVTNLATLLDQVTATVSKVMADENLND